MICVWVAHNLEVEAGSKFSVRTSRDTGGAKFHVTARCVSYLLESRCTSVHSTYTWPILDHCLLMKLKETTSQASWAKYLVQVLRTSEALKSCEATF